jgi:hypothetical protein
MPDTKADTLFPGPHSESGRLLAHLASLQIPGTPVETSVTALSGGARLSPDATSKALAELTDHGLILVEPGATTELVATVLLAPPLEEYGVRPQWAEPAGPEPPATLAEALLTSPPPPETPARRSGSRSATRSRSSASVAGLAAVDSETVTRPLPAAAPQTAAAQQAARTPATPRRRGPPARQTAPQPAPRRAEPGPSTDQTTLVRGFVERFERLLAETEQLRKRAQAAEERAQAVEKLLRAAERRADTAESRLRESQDKLRSWADLTRRMQQLSRQADSGGRGRPPAQSGT